MDEYFRKLIDSLGERGAIIIFQLSTKTELNDFNLSRSHEFDKQMCIHFFPIIRI